MEAAIFVLAVAYFITRRCLKENKEKDAIKFKKEEQR